MTVNITERKVLPQGVVVSWTSDLTTPPTYSIYRHLRLIEKTQLTSRFFPLTSGEPLDIYITDEAVPDISKIQAYPAKVVLEWDHVAGTDYYRVEEYVSSVWTVRARRIRYRDNNTHFQWESRALEDVTTHQFKVIAVGTNGNESTAKLPTVYMVRRPDPPEVSYSYDGAVAGTVTISAGV